jgi:SAM-dependent methyltransferase
MAWFKDWFDREEYDLVYHRRDVREARMMVDLIVSTIGLHEGASVLDVACGRGRHAIELAGRGLDVVGLDLSHRAIEKARLEADAAGVSARFVKADMRVPFCEGCFDCVVNLFTAFGYFDTREEHVEALRSMATSLAPDGWFVQDFLNAELVRSTLRPRDEHIENGVRIIQERWIEDDRVKKHIVVIRDGEQHSFNESVALFDLADLKAMYREAGLSIHCIFGSYEGEPYSSQSPRLILFSRHNNDASDPGPAPRHFAVGV